METLTNNSNNEVKVTLTKMPPPASSNRIDAKLFEELAKSDNPESCILIDGMKIGQINSQSQYLAKKLGVKFKSRTIKGSGQIGIWKRFTNTETPVIKSQTLATAPVKPRSHKKKVAAK